MPARRCATDPWAGRTEQEETWSPQITPPWWTVSLSGNTWGVCYMLSVRKKDSLAPANPDARRGWPEHNHWAQIARLKFDLREEESLSCHCGLMMALMVHLRTVAHLRGKGDRVAKVTFRGRTSDRSPDLNQVTAGWREIISGPGCVKSWGNPSSIPGDALHNALYYRNTKMQMLQVLKITEIYFLQYDITVISHSFH